MKYITIEQAKREKLKYYNAKKTNEAIELAAKVNPFWACTILVSVIDEDGKDLYDGTHVFLSHKSLELEITFNEYQKHFNVILRGTPKLQHADRGNNQLRRELGEPNNMGVLSFKKIQSLVTFYEKVWAYMKADHDKNKKAIDDFRASIKGYRVNWYGNSNTQGEIKRGGLTFVFEITPTFVHTRIKISSDTPDTFESFIAMTKNNIEL
jgi:hypothetical protein